jgi:hypothetical protein
MATWWSHRGSSLHSFVWAAARETIASAIVDAVRR